MKLLRVRPGPFHRIGNRYGHFINADHFLGRDAFEDLWMSKARTNVRKNGQGYTIELAFPGFKKHDIHVEINNDMLNVWAKHESSAADIIHQELGDERDRSFELPDGIDQNLVTAKLEDGLLRISIPQKNEGTHIHRTVKVA